MTFPNNRITSMVIVVPRCPFCRKQIEGTATWNPTVSVEQSTTETTLIPQVASANLRLVGFLVRHSCGTAVGIERYGPEDV